MTMLKASISIAVATVLIVTTGCSSWGDVGSQGVATIPNTNTDDSCPDQFAWDPRAYPVVVDAAGIRWQKFLIIRTDASGQTSGVQALLRLSTMLAPGDTTASYIQELSGIWTRENAPPTDFDNPPHNAPAPQGVFLYTQFGELCMTTSDNKQHHLYPNRLVWAADVTGAGHSTRTLIANGQAAVYANVRLNSTAVVDYRLVQ
jgi:hypothetical protein